MLSGGSLHLLILIIRVPLLMDCSPIVEVMVFGGQRIWEMATCKPQHDGALPTSSVYLSICLFVRASVCLATA